MISKLLRNHFVRYVALGVTMVAVLIIALAPLASVLVEGWARQDVELRSRLVFRSIRDQVAAGLAVTSGDGLVTFLDRIAEDERLLALGFCTDQAKLRFATKALPKTISCASLTLANTDTFAIVTEDGKRRHVSIFPLIAGPISGHLLVVHDLAYIDARAGKARFYAVSALVGAAAGLGLLGVAIMMALMRGWSRSMRDAVAQIRVGAAGGAQVRSEFPIGREFHALLAELHAERSFADGIHVEWSPKTLHRLLVEELPGAQVMVVSNREPYIHNRDDKGVTLQVPASGLVAALEPVMRACGGTWIAHGSGSADRETVDSHDRLRVPPDNPDYTLRRVWLSDEEQEGYYYGLANEGLWPLCHIAFVRPTFREADWAQYRAVNERFADVVAAEATCEDPIILVQDYHFALLPRMIRKRLPKATIITFWHIPWPNSETFSICPWREEVIDGLLGSTIVGFHTQFHCNNFIESVDRFMESRINREQGSIMLGGRETLVRPYPISIEWPPAALASQAPVADCRATVRSRLGLPETMKIAVGIERFDYTKGILDRIRAVDDLLTRYPEWHGKFVFVQAAAPTRSKLGAYSDLHDEVVRLVSEVNERHGRGGYLPVILQVRHHDPSEVFELFRAADVCVVSSLHDGMNLVAKEFVASRDDEQGVLILSSFAGASSELSEAIIVNPYDTHALGGAIATALQMSAGEQQQRLRLMRDVVRRRNVHRWAAQMLIDASWIRKRDAVIAPS